MRPGAACRPSCIARAPNPARRRTGDHRQSHARCRRCSPGPWPLSRRCPPIASAAVLACLAGHGADVLVILRNASSSRDLAEQIADDGIGPAGQILQADQGFAAHHGGFQSTIPNSESKPRMRLSVAVRCSTKPWRARCTSKWPCWSTALDRHEAHVGPGNGFTDGGGVGRVVLAALAGEAVGTTNWVPSGAQCDPSVKLARPVVGTEQASMPMRHGGSRCDELEQWARHAGSHQHGLPDSSTP